jgi:hypothetical protein
MHISLLNGWKRLWIVVSVLLIVPVGFMATTFIPLEEDAVDAMKAQLRHQGPVDLFEMLALENLGKGISVRESEAQINEKSSGVKITLDEVKIQNLYRDAKDIVLKKKIIVITFATLVWLMTAAAIYGLGWTVAWIVHGFRRNDL